MSMVQTIRFESGLLTLEATGAFSLEEAQRAFLEMLQAALRHRARKILFDGRAVRGQPGDWERFVYSESAAHVTRLVFTYGTAPRFAYVLHPPLKDPRKFGETVAVNRGMQVKVIETLEEAFEWLEPHTSQQAGG